MVVVVVGGGVAGAPKVGAVENSDPPLPPPPPPPDGAGATVLVEAGLQSVSTLLSPVPKLIQPIFSPYASPANTPSEPIVTFEKSIQPAFSLHAYRVRASMVPSVVEARAISTIPKHKIATTRERERERERV